MPHLSQLSISYLSFHLCVIIISLLLWHNGPYDISRIISDQQVTLRESDSYWPAIHLSFFAIGNKAIQKRQSFSSRHTVLKRHIQPLITHSNRPVPRTVLSDIGALVEIFDISKG